VVNAKGVIVRAPSLARRRRQFRRQRIVRRVRRGQGSGGAAGFAFAAVLSSRHGMGATQLMPRRANIHLRVVKHEVFEMNQLAGEIETGAGVAIMRPRCPCSVTQ
jgi:hypothetical protein